MKTLQEVEKLRREIDQCDEQLRDVVRMRVALVRRIVAHKLTSGVGMHDEEREAWIVARFKDIECPVERQLMTSLYSQIFQSGKKLWQNALEGTSNSYEVVGDLTD